MDLDATGLTSSVVIVRDRRHAERLTPFLQKEAVLLPSVHQASLSTASFMCVVIWC